MWFSHSINSLEGAVHGDRKARILIWPRMSVRCRRPASPNWYARKFAALGCLKVWHLYLLVLSGWAADPARITGHASSRAKAHDAPLARCTKHAPNLSHRRADRFVADDKLGFEQQFLDVVQPQLKQVVPAHRAADDRSGRR